MVHRVNTHTHKNKNTNKKFYPKNKNGKKKFWKGYNNSWKNENKNENTGSNQNFQKKKHWYNKNKTNWRHENNKKGQNSFNNFYPQSKNWDNYSPKNYQFNKYQQKSKVNSVPFKLKHFPDSERTAYTFNFNNNKKETTKKFTMDMMFLQQYNMNYTIQTGIYLKTPTKHNILYPFTLNLDLINEYMKKR